MPWLKVNQTRLDESMAVPIPLLALDVQRGGIPGAPKAWPVLSLLVILSLECDELGILSCAVYLHCTPNNDFWLKRVYPFLRLPAAIFTADNWGDRKLEGSK